MKAFILVIFLIIGMNSFANNCERPNWQENFHCIIAGGSANTDIAINAAHARSLALKTARLNAYEKMAEKIKGIIITSQNSTSDEALSSSKINSALKARLTQINFEKESVSFLEDGSPWAEVTISIPKYSKRDDLLFENAKSQKNQANVNKDFRLVFDIRGSEIESFGNIRIRNQESKALIFSSDMLEAGSGALKATSNESEIYEDGFVTKIVKANVENGEIVINQEESDLIKELEYKSKVLSKNKIVFLRD